MKLSILTATYNRCEMLKKLYESINKNLYKDLDIEWLIMDDGSTDDTNKLINDIQNNSKFEIKYYKQSNQGKMQAINNLITYSTGDMIIECDSDDYFMDNAFENIYQNSSELMNNDELYALVFLRDSKYKEIQGKKFENTKDATTMFDMYFRENMDGEKVVIFKSGIRKKYKYKVEQGEKFVTEARMLYEIEEKYKVKCFNIEVLSGIYTEEGYSNNINSIFIKNPIGFFKYFEEILTRDTRKIKFNKRLYVIKHFILFHVISKQKINFKNIKNFENKMLVIILYIPGVIKSKNFIKRNS